MFRATEATRSVGSALKIAVSLYLDIINLFVSLLSIFGNDND
jgi:FtsH-binding integral membrane protein